jgi:CRP/FNR family transcriptional regulator
MSTISVIQPDVCRACQSYETCFDESARERKFAVARSHRVFHNKTALWEAGDDFAGIYMLRSGSAKSFAASKDGDEHITKFHFAGELLGLDGFNRVYSHTIKFLETSSVCFFNASEIDILIKHSTLFRNNLLKSMSGELVSHGAMSLCYSSYTSEQRVAMFLLDLSMNFAQRGQSSVDFKLSMTRIEIANYLGMAMETVSRVLGKFQAFDLIEVHQRMVKINNIDALNSCLYRGDYLNISVVDNNHCQVCHA